MKGKFFLILGSIGILFLSAVSNLPAQTAQKLTVWTRSYNQPQLEPIVNKWNALGGVQIEALYIADAEYITKVSTAFATNSEPDILSSDVVYMPQLNLANRFADLTDRIKALPYGDKMIPGHLAIGTYDKKKFAIPFSVDVSVLFYNKGLFKKAGLNPNNPPRTWAEVVSASEKIKALGKDYYGFYFTGAGSGAYAFTWLPAIWASGGDILTPDAKKATINTPLVRDALSYYK